MVVVMTATVAATVVVWGLGGGGCTTASLGIHTFIHGLLLILRNRSHLIGKLIYHQTLLSLLHSRQAG
jgi:hypothetical protein